jgi:hypothetical protein
LRTYGRLPDLGQQVRNMSYKYYFKRQKKSRNTQNKKIKIAANTKKKSLNGTYKKSFFY